MTSLNYIKKSIAIAIFLLLSAGIFASCQKINDAENVNSSSSLEKKYACLVNLNDFDSPEQLAPDSYAYIYWFANASDANADKAAYEKQLMHDFDISAEHLAKTKYLLDGKYQKPEDAYNMELIHCKIISSEVQDNNQIVTCEYSIADKADGLMQFSYVYRYVINDADKIISGKTLSIE